MLETIDGGARPGGRVLDVGCGGGFLLERLAERGYSGVGVDLSPESVAIANERLLGLGAGDRLRAETGSAYDPPAGPFDLIALTDVLEHLEDPRACLRALREVVAPGGLVVVSTPNRRSLPGRPALAGRAGRARDLAAPGAHRPVADLARPREPRRGRRPRGGEPPRDLLPPRRAAGLAARPRLPPARGALGRARRLAHARSGGSASTSASASAPSRGVSPRVRAGVIAGATLALFALAIGVFVLPFAYPTPPPIVTRFGATQVFSPNARPDGTRDVARVSVRLRQRSQVTLEVKTSNGKVVRNLLVGGTHPRGWLRVSWNGHDDAGARVADGTYSIALRARSGRKRFNASRRIVVDTTPPSLRSLEVHSGALTGQAGAECRLTVTSRGAGDLTLEALRDGRVLRRLGRRPIGDDETVRWAWDGVRDDGRPARPGLVVLRATLTDPSGNPIVRERSCWLGHVLGQTAPAAPAAGAAVGVRLRTPDGSPLPADTPTVLALYRRVATPGRSLADPLGRRVTGTARGRAGRVTVHLPRGVRPSALWLVATTPRGVALIPMPSP